MAQTTNDLTMAPCNLLPGTIPSNTLSIKPLCITSYQNWFIRINQREGVRFNAWTTTEYTPNTSTIMTNVGANRWRKKCRRGREKRREGEEAFLWLALDKWLVLEIRFASVLFESLATSYEFESLLALQNKLLAISFVVCSMGTC